MVLDIDFDIMTSSLTCRSFFTAIRLSFILLLWSCMIWMIPNSRQACLKSSPALVAFALLLLFGQYVYSLNLTDDELPSHLGSVSMTEIGFKKYYDFSYQPLFIKVLIIWIELNYLYHYPISFYISPDSLHINVLDNSETIL